MMSYVKIMMMIRMRQLFCPVKQNNYRTHVCDIAEETIIEIE